jgi:PKD repeat protein
MGPHTVSYTNEGTKSVQLIVQNSFGADTTEMQVTVLPNTPMMPADFLNTDTICTGIANYSILDTLDGIGYYWSISSGGSFVGGQNGSSVQIDWTGSGEHRISVVAGNECGTSAVQEDTLYIVPEPSADFSYSADGLTVDFTIDAENFMDLEWSFGDGGKTNALNPQRQYPDRGTYTVKLKVWNECGADSISKTLELDFPSGISDVQAGITVYPNPVNGEQVLHFGQYIAGHVQILSSTGSEVLNTELFGNFLELPNLPAGVYVIRIQNGNNVTNFKILVLS